jgi:hypothetical protein
MKTTPMKLKRSAAALARLGGAYLYFMNMVPKRFEYCGRLCVAAIAALAFAQGTFSSLQAQDGPIDTSPAGGGDNAAEMARKLQDPLANISAIMTDNDVSFTDGSDASYNFQLQPVKAFSFDDAGINFIARAIIPISGAANDFQKPIFGDPVDTGGSSHIWGISDISTQFFFSPKSDAAWKWGVGPMFSLKTRTDERLAGAGWGAGPVAVITGGLSENVSLSVVGGQLWGTQDDFSLGFTQLMLYYNPPFAPGWSIGYNNTLAYDWNADSGNDWTIPLGFHIGRTLDIGGGHGLDLSAGPYWNVVQPEGAADFVLKIGVTLLFP